jgi:damage-control phosphatase, subfamily I
MRVLLLKGIPKPVRTYFDCIPCIVRQTLDAARLATEDEAVHECILREVLVATSEMDLRQSPPVMAQRIHRRIRELTGKEDPYREAKEHQNRTALEFYDRFSREVAGAANGLEMAVRLAIAGNVIDLGVKSHLDESQILAAIEDCLTDPLDGDIDQFAQAVAGATRILYLTDNAGEIVLDRLLIERLPRDRVTVAVKGAPVINDATRADAEIAGITSLVNVIDNGSDAPGTILEDCNGVFRRHFAHADLIIAKGQGNYETLREASAPLYFLLRVKCPVLARDLGCPEGRLVLRPSSSFPHSNSKPKQAQPA